MPTSRERSRSVGSALSSTLAMSSLDRAQPLVDRVAEEAVAVVDAVLDVGAQRDLEAAGLLEAELARVDREVDGAVEHHPADLVGEQVGVRRAELGAVGGAEVEQLRLTQGGPQHVDVARGLDRGDVVDEAVGVVRAALEERLVGLLELLGLLGGVRAGVVGDEGVDLGVGEAVDGVGLAGAARVEPDDVEVVAEHVAERERGVLGVGRAGRARPAGVDDQRADPVRRVVGGVLEQRQPDGLAGRVLVVDRHLERGALEVAAAGLPRQLLGVERREVGPRRVAGARLGRRGRRRGARRGAARAVARRHRRPAGSAPPRRPRPRPARPRTSPAISRDALIRAPGRGP